MKQLSVAMSDEEIDMLFSAAETPDSKNTMDIMNLCNKVMAALKSKPLPNFFTQNKTLGGTSKTQSK